MSFQIKGKRNIGLFRKCAQILTHEKEDFKMHITPDKIRLCNEFQNDSMYMFDFSNSWFSKFVPPNEIQN